MASVFHTVAWLRLLRTTYGYEPVVFTTSPPTGELTNGIVFCRIYSWLTGRRLVSLPFSDHCEPLSESTESRDFLICYLQHAMEHQEWKYMQMRPLHTKLGQGKVAAQFYRLEEYFFHVIDLKPELDEVLKSFDKDSVQRRIQRAERAGLIQKCGRSGDLLAEFYSLFLTTRRRQHIPPTPFAWFRNLISELGDAVEIRVAYRDTDPIAAIMTLRFRNVVYYKYGCSDARFNGYGATPWLFWKAISYAKSQGVSEFDLGRTESDNPGLLVFKNQWAAEPRRLVYWQCPRDPNRHLHDGRRRKIAKRIFSFLPARLQIVIGRLMYRHIG